MLFRYDNKVYVRPFANKLVEVIISKNGDVYDVQPTSTKIEITSEVNEKLFSISLEEAYKMQHKSTTKSSKLFKD